MAKASKSGRFHGGEIPVTGRGDGFSDVPAQSVKFGNERETQQVGREEIVGDEITTPGRGRGRAGG